MGPRDPSKSPCFAAKPTINVTFVKPDGTKVAVKAPVGASMLEVAHANNIDIEGMMGDGGCATPNARDRMKGSLFCDGRGKFLCLEQWA